MIHKVLILAIFLTVLTTICAAQTEELSVTGILQAKDQKYTVGDFSVRPKRDADGEENSSDKRALEVFAGREVILKGRRIDKNTLELIEARNVSYIPQKSDYPNISPTGKIFEDFVPKDWTILQKASGDLNKDGLEDAVLIVKGNAQKFIDIHLYDMRGNVQWMTNPQTGAFFSGYDGNPRILFILLKNDKGYKLFLQNNEFIRTPQFPLGETLESVKIENGELRVNFRWSDNHWVRGNSAHIFEFSDSEIILTRYDILIMRNAGYGEAKEYDFRRGTVKKTKIEKENDEEKRTIEEKRIKLEKPFNLKTIDYVGEIDES